MPITILDRTKDPSMLEVTLPERLALQAEGMLGVEHVGQGRLRLDEAVHTQETAALLRSHLQGEGSEVPFDGVGKQTGASDSDLALINERHSSVDLASDDVVIFEDYAANDKLTRRPIRLTKAALGRLAEGYRQGRSFQLYHSERRPVGSTFDAEVRQDTARGVQANWLVVRSYAVLKGAGEQRRQDIQDLQTGVRRYTSVGLDGGEWEFQEVEGEDETLYFYEIDDNPGAERGRLEATELSRVGLGAVYGAGSEAQASLFDQTDLSTYTLSHFTISHKQPTSWLISI